MSSPFSIGVGLRIEIKGAVGLLTQDAGRASGRYWPIEGSTNGIPLDGARDDAEQAIGSQEARDRKRQCLLGNIVVMREALIIDLLLAAGLVKSDNLDVERVMEIRHGGVIERNMAVNANPKADDVDGCLGKASRVGLCRRSGIRFGDDVMHRREGEMSKDGVVKPMRETLRRISRKTYVFIHMKGRYPVPVNSLLLPKATEGFCLARCGSKNHSHLRLAA
jgi:hypothetical protein